MANYSYLEGELFIDPPIEVNVVMDRSAFMYWDASDKCIMMHSTTDSEDTVDRVIPRSDDNIKAENLEAELNELIETFGKDHKIVGFIQEFYEDRNVDQGFWRFYVKDNKVTKVLPAIVWNEPI